MKFHFVLRILSVCLTLLMFFPVNEGLYRIAGYGRRRMIGSFTKKKREGFLFPRQLLIKRRDTVQE